MPDPTPPSIDYVMTFELDMGEPIVISTSPVRRFMPIKGGSVSGRFHGNVLPGGGDWQNVDDTGTINIEARYVIDLEGHGLVEVKSTGVRTAPLDVLEAMNNGEPFDASKIYFRTAIRLKASAPAPLSNRLFYSTGKREHSTVHLNVFELG